QISCRNAIVGCGGYVEGGVGALFFHIGRELVGEVWLQQDARVVDDAAEGVERDESAGGEQLFAQSAAYGAPGAGAGFESYALQRFHCGFADAARRRVDDSLEGDGVVLVLDELEVA